MASLTFIQLLCDSLVTRAPRAPQAKASVALYSVSSGIEGAKIAQETGIKSTKAVAGMLKTAREQLRTDPQLVASMLQTVMVGVSRRRLESTAPEKQFDTLRRELIFLACTYLNACSMRHGPKRVSRHTEQHPL